MRYTPIDLATYKRRAHFEYFNSLAYPYAGLTVEVDITRWLAAVRSAGAPFFHSFLWAAAGAANAVPELRCRILDGGIVRFDVCKSSYTVALPDDTYCYCTLETDMPYGEFLPYARARQAEAIAAPTVKDGEDVLGYFFISSVPWVSYTALTQPVPCPADSNPRITWGRWRDQGGKIAIPVTLLCHHALVDGIHLSRFYQRLEERLEEMVGLL